MIGRWEAELGLVWLPGVGLHQPGSQVSGQYRQPDRPGALWLSLLSPLPPSYLGALSSLLPAPSPGPGTCYYWGGSHYRYLPPLHSHPSVPGCLTARWPPWASLAAGTPSSGSPWQEVSSCRWSTQLSPIVQPLCARQKQSLPASWYCWSPWRRSSTGWRAGRTGQLSPLGAAASLCQAGTGESHYSRYQA